jgi:hypothetical protein
VPSTRFETMPSAPSPASVRGHGRAISGDMFIEQDMSVGTAQQSRQRGLAIEERMIAQILAIVLDQIEGIQHRNMRGLSAARLVET